MYFTCYLIAIVFFTTAITILTSPFHFTSQCLSSVTTALGLGFEQYAPPVFERCLKLIESTLYQSQLCQQNPTLDLPEKEFMIVALDLLSGLAQGLGSHIDPLVANSNPSLINMLGFCMVVSKCLCNIMVKT